ncbi:MAG: response regulator [Bacilli bacterium]|nr:response regulator [Bacilli bacterium]
MIARIILSLSSFLVLILLILVYYSKKNESSLSSKFYRVLLFSCVLLLIFQILTYSLYSEGEITFYSKLFYKIYWLIGVEWAYITICYFIVFLNDTEEKSILLLIKKNKSFKIYLIFTIIFIFVIFSIKIPVKNSDNYLFGLTSYLSAGYSVVTNFLILIPIFLNHGKYENEKIRNVILVPVTLGIFFIFQIIFPTIIIMGLGYVVQIVLMYFMIENPDLKLIKKIDQLKTSVERSSKAKSDFLSNMSHEIRSPMNAIIGFSETILNEENYDLASVINDVNHIKSSSKTLLEIINNILDISKIETGSDTLEMKEYSLKNLIVDWTGIVDARLEGKNIKFILEVDKEIPNKLYGDSTKIFQVVLNILTNAVKYTEVGRIKMSISRTYDENRNLILHFKVSDTGFGIKEEDYDKVFQKFSRLDSAKTNEIEGTGLGLVLTKKYAELMGGSIWFESEYGAGTTFYFNVPQRIIDPTPMGDITESINEETNKDLIDCSKYSVLIVDDDELNLKVTERLLGGYKFKIDKLSNPEECITRFKMGYHYDIVFLDHVMPRVDGIELVHVIKNLKGYYVPPVIALTANAITGVREMYLKEGFDEYLSKPIDINELDRIIEKYFKKQ